MGSLDTRTSTPHVLLVEARLPQYRVATWTLLRDQLARRGIRFTLAVGEPNRTEREAEDERDLDWAIRCPTSHWRAGSLRMRNIRSSPLLSDLEITHVIFEQALTDLGTYRTWVRARVSGQPIGLFGHGINYSHSPGSLRNRVKTSLSLRADWFFAYSGGGIDSLQRAGFPLARITVVNNALEDLHLKASDPIALPPKARDFRTWLVPSGGVVGLHIGALEPRKGIGVLLAALPRIVERVPDFHLVVAGGGSLMPDIRRAAAAGLPVIELGRVDGDAKAMALLASDLVVMPRHLGLAVVDALHAGRPVVTTRGRWHNPEAEYLTSENCVWTAPDARSLADGVADLVEDPDRLARLKRGSFEAGRNVTLENMVARFSEGIVEWVAA